MRLICALMLSFTLASCGSNFANTVQEFAADQLLPVEQENELGAQLAAELELELTMHPNAEVQSYISALGDQVVAVAADADPAITFRFHVVQDDDTINAFAIPGGYIYLYTGLLLAAESEAEVMAVLAHEVSHVTQRHVAERLVAAVGLETAIAMALGNDPSAVTEMVAQIAGNGALLRHSRTAETEADEVGFGYQVGAGYDPQGFIDFFEKLTGGPRQPEFFSSHPNPDNRIDAIETMIGARDDWPDQANAERYLEFQRLLSPTVQ